MCVYGVVFQILGPGLRLGWILVPQDIYRNVNSLIDRCLLISISSDCRQVCSWIYLRLYGVFIGISAAWLVEALEKICRLMLPSKNRGGFISGCIAGRNDATLILQKLLKGGSLCYGETFDRWHKNDAMRFICNTDEAAIQRHSHCEAIREVCG